MKKPLKVIINAQLYPSGASGGVEQFIMGLIYGLGKLGDGSEEYLIVTHWQNPNWLKPYLGPNERTVIAPSPNFFRKAINSLNSSRNIISRLWGSFHYFLTKFFKLTLLIDLKSNKFFRSLNGNVVHFPYQRFIYCNFPAIFNPHDLQHLYYPHFFSKGILYGRKANYPRAFRLAHAIVTDAQFVKADIIKQYKIDPKKIFVIYMGAPTELYEPLNSKILSDVREKYKLPKTFILYPAQTWPHKNHIRLLKAIKMLQTRDNLLISLVCTGKKNEFWPIIKNYIHKLNLEAQVTFLGFIDPVELRALYHLSQFVIYPSLFEGGGLPQLEAFLEGAPVTCSSVSAMPEYGGEAVLLFDPNSIKNIAEAIKKMATNENLRNNLRERGSKRIKLFSWKQMARRYRALYRKVAGYPLTEEDYKLLIKCS